MDVEPRLSSADRCSNAHPVPFKLLPVQDGRDVFEVPLQTCGGDDDVVDVHHALAPPLGPVL
jgi:hypothetical protein